MKTTPDIVIELRDVHVSYRFVQSVRMKDQAAALLTGGGRLRATRSVEALRGITLSVPRGETLGIIGPNGAGKSTLLKAIAGVFEPDSGELKVHADSVSLLALGAGFQNALSGVENVELNGLLLGLTLDQIRSRFEDIVAFAGIGDAVNNPLKTYSSGMKSRLAFAIAAHVDPEVLLIDEVLGVGDEAFRKKSQERIVEMIHSHRTVAIVTHNTSYIRRTCDTAVWIDAGKLVEYGPAPEVVDHYLKSV